MLRFVSLGALGFLLASCGAAEEPNPERTGLVVQGVNYIGLSVRDLDRATAFHSGAIDLEIVEDAVLSGSPALDALAGRQDVRVKTRMLRSANAQLRLMAFENPSVDAQSVPETPVQGPGIAHVCYQVDKETDAYGRFLAAGGAPIGDREMVQLNPENPVEYAYVRDPDGHVIEVEHVDVAALNLSEPPKNKYRIRHVALATPDMDRAVQFYSSFLDIKKPRRIGSWLFNLSGDKIDAVSGLDGSKLYMSWFQVRNIELEISQYVSHPTELPEKARPVDAQGFNMIVFDVTDIGAARDKLLQAGGTIVSEVEDMDGGQIQFGRDPDGNLLGLQVVAPEAVVSAKNFKDNGI